MKVAWKCTTQWDICPKLTLKSALLSNIHLHHFWWSAFEQEDNYNLNSAQLSQLNIQKKTSLGHRAHLGTNPMVSLRWFTLRRTCIHRFISPSAEHSITSVRECCISHAYIKCAVYILHTCVMWRWKHPVSPSGRVFVRDSLTLSVSAAVLGAWALRQSPKCLTDWYFYKCCPHLCMRAFQ